jgi:hypothetical protein
MKIPTSLVLSPNHLDIDEVLMLDGIVSKNEILNHRELEVGGHK